MLTHHQSSWAGVYREVASGASCDGLPGKTDHQRPTTVWPLFQHTQIAHQTCHAYLMNIEYMKPRPRTAQCFLKLIFLAIFPHSWTNFS